jgi:hypothetical protein
VSHDELATPSRTRGPNLPWLGSKPTGAPRLVFRLPIYLYRLNLARLLGHRFLLLIHQGVRAACSERRYWRCSSTNHLRRRAWCSPPGGRRLTGTAT